MWTTLRNIIVLIAWLAAGAAVEASSVRSLNLEELTRNAATIFSGRCAEVEAVVDPVLGREITRVTFEVDRAVKGSVASTHTIRMVGANGVAGGWGLTGLPQFQPGEEVVVYLYGESRLGLSSPVAFGQGKFNVLRDKQGRAVAINGSGNARLTRGMSPAAEQHLQVRSASWSDPAQIDPEALLDLTEALVEGIP